MSIIDRAAKRLAQIQSQSTEGRSDGMPASTDVPPELVPTHAVSPAPSVEPPSLATQATQAVHPTPAAVPALSGVSASAARPHRELTLLESPRATSSAPTAIPFPAAPQAHAAATPAASLDGPPPKPAAAPPRHVDLDLVGIERAGYLVANQKRSLLAEEFRRLKRPLLQAWQQGKAAGSIVVTSAVPGEGKTFFALNLAMSLASEIDLHVLLVDADVAHPEAMRRLGVGDAAVGLLDVLSETAELDDAILATNIPSLEVLPAGRPRATSTELIASQAMREALARLMSRHPKQIIVIDGPPLLATNDAQVLAASAGQVVMVVAGASTPRDLVVKALESIEQCPNVATVLNKSDVPAVPRGYGYY